jgi:hypothetical protein
MPHVGALQIRWMVRRTDTAQGHRGYAPGLSELLLVRQQEQARPRWLEEHFRRLCEPAIDIHGPGRRDRRLIARSVRFSTVSRTYGSSDASGIRAGSFSHRTSVRRATVGDTVAWSALEYMVSAMPRGSVAEVLRLVEGRRPPAYQSLWGRVMAWTRHVERLCLVVPTGVGDKRRAVIDALRRARRAHRRERRRRPATPMLLRADLAIGELAAVIMRHGPPRLSSSQRPLPG